MAYNPGQAVGILTVDSEIGSASQYILLETLAEVLDLNYIRLKLLVYTRAKCLESHQL